MKKRQPDGRWRGPKHRWETALRARWLEAELLHLKQMRISFEAIAWQVARVGRGQAQAMSPLPEGIGFPKDFQVSRQTCHQALKRALARESALAAEA